jgi:hypothetical protein
MLADPLGLQPQQRVLHDALQPLAHVWAQVFSSTPTLLADGNTTGSSTSMMILEGQGR